MNNDPSTDALPSSQFISSKEKISLVTVASNADQFINAPLAENILKEKQASYALFSMMLGDWLTSQGLRAHELGDYSIIHMLERRCEEFEKQQSREAQ